MSVSRSLAVAGLCAWIGAWATDVAAAPYPETGGLDGFEDATSAARRAMVHPIAQQCHDASAVGTCSDAAVDPNGRVGSNVRQEVPQNSVARGPLGHGPRDARAKILDRPTGEGDGRPPGVVARHTPGFETCRLVAPIGSTCDRVAPGSYSGVDELVMAMDDLPFLGVPAVVGAPGAGLAGTDAGDRAPYRLAGPVPASSVHVGGVLSKIRHPEPGTPLLLGLVLFAAAFSVPRLRART